MKKYYISYYKDFSNCFTLASCETLEDVKSLDLLEGCFPFTHWERITYRKARAKIASEKAARKYDPEFSGYGDIVIRSASEIVQGMRDCGFMK